MAFKYAKNTNVYHPTDSGKVYYCKIATRHRDGKYTLVSTMLLDELGDLIRTFPEPVVFPHIEEFWFTTDLEKALNDKRDRHLRTA